MLRARGLRGGIEGSQHAAAMFALGLIPGYSESDFYDVETLAELPQAVHAYPSPVSAYTTLLNSD